MFILLCKKTCCCSKRAERFTRLSPRKISVLPQSVIARSSVRFLGAATRGVGGYRMKQIILLVFSKIYYTICNRKAQVFLRIMYIIPHNIRTQKKSGRRKNAGRNSCHSFTLLAFNSALCIILLFLLNINKS